MPIRSFAEEVQGSGQPAPSTRLREVRRAWDSIHRSKSLTLAEDAAGGEEEKPLVRAILPPTPTRDTEIQEGCAPGEWSRGNSLWDQSVCQSSRTYLLSDPRPGGAWSQNWESTKRVRNRPRRMQKLAAEKRKKWRKKKNSWRNNFIRSRIFLEGEV